MVGAPRGLRMARGVNAPGIIKLPPDKWRSRTTGNGYASNQKSTRRSTRLQSGGHESQSAVTIRQPSQVSVASAAQTIWVDLRPCGGACGRSVGIRLPSWLVEVIKAVKVALDLRYECEVLIKYPDLCNVRHRGIGHGSSHVKARERNLSRAVQFKASYVLSVVKYAGGLGEVEDRLRLAFEDYLSYRGGGDVDGFINGLLGELGFRSLRELALYLWWLLPSEVYGGMVGLVDFVEATRRGWVNIIKLRCRLDGAEIPTTVDLPTFIRLVVRHFRHVHGLATWRDVAKAVLEAKRLRDAEKPEGNDIGVKLLRHSAEVTQLVRLVVHRLMDVGLLERFGKVYRCRICNADVGGTIDALAHALNHHYDVISKLLGGRPTPSAGGVDSVVDELASLFNTDGVKPAVKALVQGIIDVLNTKGSISIPMLTRWLNEDDDYRLLLGSLTTSSMKPERVVAMIVEVLARHGLVQVNGEVVRLGE